MQMKFWTAARFLVWLLVGSSIEAFVVKKAPLKASAKDILLRNLDDPLTFNSASKERTQLVADLTKENPVDAPGSSKSFTPLAVGTWRIIYAPHIYTMGSLFQGSFDPVYYIMKPNGKMTSHARYNFPIIGSGWLSVSGTYSSEDEENVCRVDFDKAWVKLIDRKNNDDDDDSDDVQPFESLEAVPPSPWKDGIQALGKLFFIDAVSKFPVSYLDKDTIVFDFELLGTRICARKVGPVG